MSVQVAALRRCTRAPLATAAAQMALSSVDTQTESTPGCGERLGECFARYVGNIGNYITGKWKQDVLWCEMHNSMLNVNKHSDIAGANSQAFTRDTVR